MALLRYTRLAREDLLQIWARIAPQNMVAADRVYDHIEENCGFLRDFPLLGRVRPEIAEDARSLAVERWIVLYRVTGNGPQIVRIVDGARDLANLEWPEQ